MYRPRIGFVSNILVNDQKLYYRTAKLETLKKLGLDKIIEIYKSNIETATQIVKYCCSNGIQYYRMGNLFPFSGHEIIGNFDYLNYFSDDIYELGQLIKVNDLRISFHASEFCVLNSKNSKIVEKSIVELKNTVNLANSLDLAENNKIIVHTGSSEGGIEESIKRFSDTYLKLDQDIKKRITLENDDKIFSFAKVYEIYKQTAIPLTIDIFHHEILNPENIEEITALKMAIETWKGLIPEIHFSCQSLTQDKRGSHSEMIDVEKLLNFLDKTNGLEFSIMLETKGTNVAAEDVLNRIKNYYKNQPRKPHCFSAG